MPAFRLLQVTAPHFVAGAIYRHDLGGWRCVQAAPIISYLTKLSAQDARAYLARKGWSWQWVEAWNE